MKKALVLLVSIGAFLFFPQFAQACTVYYSSQGAGYRPGYNYPFHISLINNDYPSGANSARIYVPNASIFLNSSSTTGDFHQSMHALYFLNGNIDYTYGAEFFTTLNMPSNFNGDWTASISNNNLSDQTVCDVGGGWERPTIDPNGKYPPISFTNFAVDNVTDHSATISFTAHNLQSPFTSSINISIDNTNDWSNLLTTTHAITDGDNTIDLNFPTTIPTITYNISIQSNDNLYFVNPSPDVVTFDGITPPPGSSIEQDSTVQQGALSLVLGMQSTIFDNIRAVLPTAGLVLVTLLGITILIRWFHRIARR